MRAIFAALLCVAALASGCSGGTSGSDQTIAPAIEGKQLDAAKSLLKKAGVADDDVEIVGGGVLGVVNESNWTVCTQSPDGGEPLSGSITLTVERTCADPSSSPEPAEESSAPAEEPTADEESVSDTFKMPNLVGDVLQDAQDELQSLGSYLLRQDDATGSGRFQVLDSNWKVCSQKQAPGAKVEIVEMIVLTAVKLNETCP